MAFAGEVFPEWYWGPIFFYFVFGLPLVGGGVRRSTSRCGGGCAGCPGRSAGGCGSGSCVAGSLAILGGRAADRARPLRARGEGGGAAARLHALRGRDAPARLRRGARATPTTSSAGRCSSAATASGRAPYAFAYQQRRPPSSRCRTGTARCAGSSGRARASTRVRAASCARRAGGRCSSGACGRHRPSGGEAFSLLDGTLVRLEHTPGLPDGDVLAYFDALRPVAPGDLDFKQG